MKSFWVRLGWLVPTLLLAGVFLRFVDLGRASYQIDELATMQMWRQDRTPSDIYRHALKDLSWNYRMPLLPLVNLGVMRLTGTLDQPQLPPEWAARLPHALFGLATLPFLWLLGRRAGGPRVGLWALFLGTFSVFHIYYAREAYDYAMLIFFTTATVAALLRLLDRFATRDRVDGWSCLAYITSSTLLLQSHLSGLLFLAPLNGLAALYVLLHPALRKRLRGPWLGAWLGTLAFAYVAFIPFLIPLLGFKEMGGQTVKFSWQAVPDVLGHMGWGRGGWAFGTMLATLAAGLWVAVRRPAGQGTLRLLLLLMVQLVVYSAIQTWMLRVARFEVRYYSPAFPLLITLLAAGLDAFASQISRHLRWPSAGRIGPTLVALPLLVWLSPSLLDVVQLGCRGYDYKGIADWVMKHVPPGGTYAFYNAYELRGVPGVYPTPERMGTAAAFWSTAQDFQRVNPPERVRDLFQRFPQVYLVEIAPDDLLLPTRENHPIDRDAVLARHVWLADPPTERLFERRLHPLGETQVANRYSHRVLISYNEPGDMPELARRQGRSLYHWLEPGWMYTRDQAFRHWMVTRRSAYLRIGNLLEEPQKARLSLELAAPPTGANVRLYLNQQLVISTTAIPANRWLSLSVPEVMLPPGESRLLVEVTPASGQLDTQLILQALSIEPTP